MKNIKVFKNIRTAAVIVFALLLALCAGLGLLLGNKQAVSASAEKIEKTVVLDDCDKSDAFTNIYTVNHTSYIKGTGSILAASPLGTINAVFQGIDYNNLPAYEDAYLEMYLYVGDADNITDGGALEITSSGINDVDEITYIFTPQKIAMKSGWNYISLKLEDFQGSSGNVGGSFNYNKICGMRIFAFPKDGSKFLEIGVDEIILTDTPRFEEVKASGITVKGDKYPSMDYIVCGDTSAQLFGKGALTTTATVLIVIGSVLLLGAIGGAIYIIVKKRKV